MPNQITTTGLQTATQTELYNNAVAAYQLIYGAQINLASNTQDGQQINIYNQAQLDIQDLLTTIYNGFDPDNAIGVVLDQRVAINGIQRQAGTYTLTNITVITSQSVNLYGLDQTAQQVYTISDSAGNLWELQTTQLGTGVGTFVYVFEAATIGAVSTTPNTINIQVTIVLGVTSVNNPTTYTTLGVNQESDAQLRLRRQISVSLPSQGYLQGLYAAINNVPGVTSSQIYENLTGTTNGDGVPGHTIWVIVSGTGAASAIANAIYVKRNAGAGMYGATSYAVTQIDGSTFTVYWDSSVSQEIFIEFTTTAIAANTVPNDAAIQTGLPAKLVPTLYQTLNVNQIASTAQAIDPNSLVTSPGLSSGLVQTLSLSGVAASGAFVLKYNGNSTASINWNDSLSTIQTKVRAVTGLGAATLTGSIASQSLVITLNASALGLIYNTTNTLQTAGSVAITFSYNPSYQNTLTPTNKKSQFVITSNNIIILPILISPSAPTVAHTGTQQFSAVGGYTSYTWALTTNNSGGSITSPAGLYTAGSTYPATDIVTVTDVLGNTATASITVD